MKLVINERPVAAPARRRAAAPTRPAAADAGEGRPRSTLVLSDVSLRARGRWHTIATGSARTAGLALMALGLMGHAPHVVRAVVAQYRMENR